MIKLHIFNGWWNLQHVVTMYTITVVIIIHAFLVSQYIYIHTRTGVYIASQLSLPPKTT